MSGYFCSAENVENFVNHFQSKVDEKFDQKFTKIIKRTKNCEKLSKLYLGHSPHFDPYEFSHFNGT